MGLLDHPSSSGSSQPGSSSRSLKIDWSKWFPPVTSRTFLSHYLPASGAISHTLYTVHLFSPNIISNLFPTGDLAVSNTILFNANVGLGFYVYFRRHLHRVNPWERVEFSVLTSTLFNFGSLLAAVLIKALFPAKSHTWLKSLVATTLSVYLLSRAYRYLGLLDNRSSRGSVSPSRSPTLASKSRNGRRSIASTSSRAPSVISIDIQSNHHIHSPSISPPTTTTQMNQEEHQHHNLPMTPSATNYSETEKSISEMGGGEDIKLSEDRQNYRYLHSFALNNLNQNGPTKENIIRRTTMKRPKDVMRRLSATNNWQDHKVSTQSACFVTPEPSMKDCESGLYTPPPSRNEKMEEKKKKRIDIRRKQRNEIEEKEEMIEKVLDMIQYHGPLALIPFVFGCFVTGTVPMYSTIRFIFSR